MQLMSYRHQGSGEGATLVPFHRPSQPSVKGKVMRARHRHFPWPLVAVAVVTLPPSDTGPISRPAGTRRDNRCV
jgi:hypothetical protein